LNRFNLIPIFSILLVFGGSTISDAYAYIDPGSGSVMIQGLIGALVGAGIAIKLYWAKIRMALETKFSKS
jgi:hypothetical protein